MATIVEEVKRLFEDEFSAVRERFHVLDIAGSEVKESTEECVYHPGVYVWFHPDKGVLKVGRHFTNSRKRFNDEPAELLIGLIQ